MRTRKRGETMEPKKAGRPPSDETMTDRLFVRVNKETLSRLNECTQELEISRSDVVRKGIDMVYESLKR